MWYSSLEPGFGPGMSLGPFSGISSSDTYTDLGPGNSVDIDTSRPQFDGLDDSQRPSIDSNFSNLPTYFNKNFKFIYVIVDPIYEEEMPPVQKNVTTYDELRKKNREEYQQKRTLSYREPTRSAAPPPSPSPSSNVPEGMKNKYGDVWE